MGVRVAAFYCLLLFHILILQGVCNGSSGSTEMDHHKAAARTDMRIQQVHSHAHHHMDSSLIVFFFVEDLKQGNTIPIYFPKRESNGFHHLLSKQESDAIPFSYQELDQLLQFFSFARGSPQANAMEDTLRQCETKPIEGEIKLCATSQESLVEFAKEIFGSQSQFELHSTAHTKRSASTAALQKYTVMGTEEIEAEKSIACHTMPYPYPVLYCHYQASKSRVFRASLAGENGGDEAEAIAVCHMDTSKWSPNHVSFKVLGIEAGSSPVCHFFPSDNFVLVPSAKTAIKA